MLSLYSILVFTCVAQSPSEEKLQRVIETECKELNIQILNFPNFVQNAKDALVLSGGVVKFSGYIGLPDKQQTPNFKNVMTSKISQNSILNSSYEDSSFLAIKLQIGEGRVSFERKNTGVYLIYAGSIEDLMVSVIIFKPYKISRYSYFGFIRTGIVSDGITGNFISNSMREKFFDLIRL